ncbi:unnamed protein product, partial [Polarella glacialis]
AELRSTHRADVDAGKFAALERSFVNLRVEASAIASQQQQHQPGGRGRSSEATDGPQDAQTPAMMTSGPRALSFAEVAVVVGCLADAVVKIARCCGLVSGAGSVANDPALRAVERLSLGDILAWERGGLPLAARIEQSWSAQVNNGCSGPAPTLLSLVRKAEKGDDERQRLESSFQEL